MEISRAGELYAKRNTVKNNNRWSCKRKPTGWWDKDITLAVEEGEKGNVLFVMRMKVTSELPVRAWEKVALYMIGKKADIDSRSKQGHSIKVNKGPTENVCNEERETQFCPLPHGSFSTCAQSTEKWLAGSRHGASGRRRGMGNSSMA